jgi:hypothetical protein
MTPYAVIAIHTSPERLEKHLREMQRAAEYQQQRAADLQARLEVGSKNYAEQRPYDLLRLVMQYMTTDELRTILERAAPPTEPRPKPEPDNQQLFTDLMKTLRRANGRGWKIPKQ